VDSPISVYFLGDTVFIEICDGKRRSSSLRFVTQVLDQSPQCWLESRGR